MKLNMLNAGCKRLYAENDLPGIREMHHFAMDYGLQTKRGISCLENITTWSEKYLGHQKKSILMHFFGLE